MLRAAIVSLAAASALVGCAIPSDAGPERGLAPIMAQHVSLAGSSWLGEPATRLELTAEEQTRQLQGAGGNRPTFVVLGRDFTNGVIEVDVAAVINGMGGNDARGFVGIAFHIDDRRENFEAVYLRMANGTLNDPLPPAPRDVRAVQYVAHPGFHFADSRAAAPGRYEKPAAVKLGRWHRLRLEIEGGDLAAFVDANAVLQFDDLKYATQQGDVGIWVGDGTTAYIRNFRAIRR